MGNLKKILFIDATLHKKNATAITLSNLFSSWPKENLFMVGSQEMIQLSKHEGFLNNFSLDDKDYYHRFPLGFFLKLWKLLRKKNSVLSTKETSKTSTISLNKTEISNKYSLRSLSFVFFQRLGLDHLFFRQIISNELRSWIKKSDPDYFYAVLSTRHSILFAEKLLVEFNKPIIIHIMDDWPSTIGSDCVFKKYWNKKINLELKKLLSNVYKRVAISELMALEFESRFGGKWDYFHNPIHFPNWLPYQRKIISSNSGIIKIAYFGRIGRANDKAFLTFVDAIKELIEVHLVSVQINIYSNNLLPTAYLGLDFIKVNGFINHTEIPKEIARYDYLILPLSFNDKDLAFSRLSIPTKLSEYLISGVPVILFAPKETAAYKFVVETNSAFVIDTPVTTDVAVRLSQFFSDENKQYEISKNARMVANQNFSSEIIDYKFSSLFT
ncbi:MAG: glycosyltransferase family 4 protein [Candidatus Staskawiczbacteria bacterium]|nr:glycosyltransferase family 4 protein [Candidatus Staskawiczbacteria bacterium]